jgi:hypothetical protein
MTASYHAAAHESYGWLDFDQPSEPWSALARADPVDGVGLAVVGHDRGVPRTRQAAVDEVAFDLDADVVTSGCLAGFV